MRRRSSSVNSTGVKAIQAGSGHELLRDWFAREKVKKADFAETIKVSPSAISQYVSENPDERVAPRAAKRALIEIETRGAVPASSWETAEEREAVKAARSRVAREQRAAGSR